MITDKYNLPDLSIENEYNCIVAGVDEAGRGPWAGPVVASAVIIDVNNVPDFINDSKKISAKKREIIFEDIMQKCQVGVGIASEREIDELNILQATMVAMQRAVENLPNYPKLVLVDGNRAPKLQCDVKTIIKGDAKSVSIGAASIVAKVTRDRIMQDLDKKYPMYMWAKNSGYGTKAHISAINEHGITDHHRKSFKPIKLHI